MAGFPGFLVRLSLGKIFKNRSRIRNPETAMSAEEMNLALWQLAGMNGCVPRAWIKCQVSGGVITVVDKWLAWDPNQSLLVSEITMGYTSAGVYTWALAHASYPDQSGADTPISIRFAEVVGGAAARWGVGTVDGSGIAGSVLIYNGVGGAAADVTSFLLKLY